VDTVMEGLFLNKISLSGEFRREKQGKEKLLREQTLHFILRAGSLSALPRSWSQSVESTPHHPPFRIQHASAAIAGTDELTPFCQGLL
jgi:hypothetical protein